MTAGQLSAVNDPPNFKLKNGRVIWETISMKNSEKCLITRIVESGGKPFFLGLRYKQMYIHPDTELEVIDACPYCGEKDCTSDHK
jgi:hypothetical protein